MTTIFITV